MNISTRNSMRTGLLLLSLCAAGSAWANSKFLNVQGKLTDTSGNPLTGSQTVTFRLYTSSTAVVGAAIWTESQTISLSTGLFNVSLGTVTALDSISFNQQYYLGIQVAGDADELLPRQPLGTSAYALGSLGNFNVGNNLVVGGSLGINTSTPTSKIHLSSGVLTVDGTGAGSNVAGPSTATYFYGNGSGLTWVSGVEGNTFTSSKTFTNGSFSIGATTFTVAGGNVGLGTATPASKLHISSGALLLDGTANSVTAASASLTGAGAGYTLTVASGIIVQNGGSIKLSTGGIVWADGTVSTTAASGGGGGSASPCSGGIVRVSSGAVNTITSTVWTTVPESTITYTANGCQALLTYHCGFDVLSGAANVHVGVYANGALMDLQSSTQGFDYTHDVTDKGEDTLFTHITAATYTGTTSFAVVFYTDNSVRQGATGGIACEFAAQEVP